MSNPNEVEMRVLFKGQLLNVNVPDDPDQHLVMVVVDQVGISIFRDGFPIDVDTGDQYVLQPSSDLLKAADEMVKLWRDSGWKLSTSAGVLEKAVSAYEAARKTMDEPTPPEPEPVQPTGLPTNEGPSPD